MFETFKSMLVNELSVNEADVKAEAELVNDLGINSLELADLILHCEEEFSIEISDDDVREFMTVDDVVKYLEKACAAKN